MKAQRGGTIVGFIVGLVVGLAIAVVVALVITKAPIPFINKLAHAPDKNDIDPGNIPDPNKSLYSRDAQANGQAPVLGNSVTTTPGAAAANPPLVVTATPAAVPALGAAATPTAPPAGNVQDGKPTMLQAGAFNSGDAAENMKAKLALLGFEAIVAPSTGSGATVYRVRLGPYSHIDDLNRVRSRLAENGIDASIVPQAK
jgi:cell division protein FtsN